MFVNPALRWLKQENHKFKASLDYIDPVSRTNKTV
jgi:hypothetical protein